MLIGAIQYGMLTLTQQSSVELELETSTTKYYSCSTVSVGLGFVRRSATSVPVGEPWCSSIRVMVAVPVAAATLGAASGAMSCSTMAALKSAATMRCFRGELWSPPPSIFRAVNSLLVPSRSLYLYSGSLFNGHSARRFT